MQYAWYNEVVRLLDECHNYKDLRNLSLYLQKECYETVSNVVSEEKARKAERLSNLLYHLMYAIHNRIQRYHEKNQNEDVPNFSHIIASLLSYVNDLQMIIAHKKESKLDETLKHIVTKTLHFLSDHPFRIWDVILQTKFFKKKSEIAANLLRRFFISAPDIIATSKEYMKLIAAIRVWRRSLGKSRSEADNYLLAIVPPKQFYKWLKKRNIDDLPKLEKNFTSNDVVEAFLIKKLPKETWNKLLMIMSFMSDDNKDYKQSLPSVDFENELEQMETSPQPKLEAQHRELNLLLNTIVEAESTKNIYHTPLPFNHYEIDDDDEDEIEPFKEIDLVNLTSEDSMASKSFTSGSQSDGNLIEIYSQPTKKKSKFNVVDISSTTNVKISDLVPIVKEAVDPNILKTTTKYSKKAKFVIENLASTSRADISELVDKVEDNDVVKSSKKKRKSSKKDRSKINEFESLNEDEVLANDDSPKIESLEKPKSKKRKHFVSDIAINEDQYESLPPENLITNDINRSEDYLPRKKIKKKKLSQNIEELTNTLSKKRKPQKKHDLLLEFDLGTLINNSEEEKLEGSNVISTKNLKRKTRTNFPGEICLDLEETISINSHSVDKDDIANGKTTVSSKKGNNFEDSTPCSLTLVDKMEIESSKKQVEFPEKPQEQVEPSEKPQEKVEYSEKPQEQVEPSEKKQVKVEPSEKQQQVDSPQEKQQQVDSPQEKQQQVDSPQEKQQQVDSPQEKQQQVDSPQEKQQQVDSPQEKQQQVDSPQEKQQQVDSPQEKQQQVDSPQEKQQQVDSPQEKQQQVDSPQEKQQQVDSPQETQQQVDSPQKTQQQVDSPQKTQQQVDSPQKTQQQVDSPQKTQQQVDFPQKTQQQVDFPQKTQQQVDSPQKTQQQVDSPQKTQQQVDSPQKTQQQVDSPQKTQQVDSPQKTQQQVDSPQKTQQQVDSPQKTQQQVDSPQKTQQQVDSPQKTQQQVDSPQKTQQQVDSPQKKQQVDSTERDREEVFNLSSENISNFNNENVIEAINESGNLKTPENSVMVTTTIDHVAKMVAIDEFINSSTTNNVPDFDKPIVSSNSDTFIFNKRKTKLTPKRKVDQVSKTKKESKIQNNIVPTCGQPDVDKDSSLIERPKNWKTKDKLKKRSTLYLSSNSESGDGLDEQLRVRIGKKNAASKKSPLMLSSSSDSSPAINISNNIIESESNEINSEVEAVEPHLKLDREKFLNLSMKTTLVVVENEPSPSQMNSYLSHLTLPKKNLRDINSTETCSSSSGSLEILIPDVGFGIVPSGNSKESSKSDSDSEIFLSPNSSDLSDEECIAKDKQKEKKNSCVEKSLNTAKTLEKNERKNSKSMIVLETAENLVSVFEKPSNPVTLSGTTENLDEINSHLENGNSTNVEFETKTAFISEKKYINQVLDNENYKSDVDAEPLIIHRRRHSFIDSDESSSDSNGTVPFLDDRLDDFNDGLDRFEEGRLSTKHYQVEKPNVNFETPSSSSKLDKKAQPCPKRFKSSHTVLNTPSKILRMCPKVILTPLDLDIDKSKILNSISKQPQTKDDKTDSDDYQKDQGTQTVIKQSAFNHLIPNVGKGKIIKCKVMTLNSRGRGKYIRRLANSSQNLSLLSPQLPDKDDTEMQKGGSPIKETDNRSHSTPYNLRPKCLKKCSHC